jgi:hypothetical protein
MRRRSFAPAVVGVFVCGALLASPAARGEDWEDGVRDEMEQRVRALEEAARARSAPAVAQQDPGLPVRVVLEHGDVRFVQDLARVDVTIQVSNAGSGDIEWTRRYDVDEQAEVVGASLTRRNAGTITCRTLPLDDARRIYGEARNPRPTPGRPGRDPLRVERDASGALDVVVWPVGPGETVQVGLTFVTPLRGHGSERVYVDPIRAGGRTAPTEVDGGAPLVADRLVRVGGVLAYASASADWVAAGDVGGVLRFVDAAGRDEHGTLSFTALRGTEGAVSVRGGGFGTRVGVWRFDPAEHLRSRGIEPREGLEVRLVRVPGAASRIAPDRFDALDEPLPVTSRLHSDADAVRYEVHVLEDGEVVDVSGREEPLTRASLERKLEDALTAWHRARLVRRVLAWAAEEPDEDGERQRAAVGYAVDAGVLAPGTAALALPPLERRLLTPRSRWQFDTDGVPLGASNGAADLRSPPAGVR